MVTNQRRVRKKTFSFNFRLKKDSVQQFILGTHTSQSEQNYLMIGKVMLPLEDSEVSKTQGYQTEKSKIEITQRINHDGEVNKARYMPQDFHIIASKSPSPTIFIFDYTKHSSSPTNDICSPELKLKGHKKDGYGLSWNSKVKGRLLSGSDDGLICIWDLESKTENGNEVNALMTFHEHEDIVEDVSWNKFHDSIFGSVSDDKTVRIWDSRKDKSTNKILGGHGAEINSLDFSPFNEFLFLTGSGDKKLKLWDLRNLKQELHTLEGHTDEVFTVAWSPFNETILGSSGSDRRVMIWDLSRIGMDQSSEDAEDGVPELLFIHGKKN
jgi:histone-binding protein RBBP4